MFLKTYIEDFLSATVLATVLVTVLATVCFELNDNKADDPYNSISLDKGSIFRSRICIHK